MSDLDSLRSFSFLLSDISRRCPGVPPQCQRKRHEFILTDMYQWWAYWCPWKFCISNKNRQAKFSKAESFVGSLENSNPLVILSCPLASLVAESISQRQRNCLFTQHHVANFHLPFPAIDGLLSSHLATVNVKMFDSLWRNLFKRENISLITGLHHVL